MINGIINIYKIKGFTSHDVVAKLRGIMRQKKIGHTGTLDPDATGVLPVCLGSATKLCDMLTDKSKTYEAVLLLGVTTDTQDTSGTVLKEADTNALSEEVVRQAVSSFVGEYMQIPPMYSALKVNGKKLYELAREGIEIERKARPISIFSIAIKEINLPRVRMEVACSKGTYIRTLCHDIGEALGCGGCMETLIRTRVSRFALEDSVTLAQIQQLKEVGKLEEVVTPIDVMFEEYKPVVLKDEFVSFAYNGNVFLPKHLEGQVKFCKEQMVRVYNKCGEFIAIYQYIEEKNMFQIEKMFYERKS